jgi:hypothetical protein
MKARCHASRMAPPPDIMADHVHHRSRHGNDGTVGPPLVFSPEDYMIGVTGQPLRNSAYVFAHKRAAWLCRHYPHRIAKAFMELRAAYYRNCSIKLPAAASSCARPSGAPYSKPQ